MTNKTIPATRVRIEPVTLEVREAFAAFIFSVTYDGAIVPQDAIVVMVPRARPTSRSVRVFHGTQARKGAEQALEAVRSFQRTESDDPPVELTHSRHTVADLEAFAARGTAAQSAARAAVRASQPICYDMGLRDPSAPAGYYCGLAAGHDGAHSYTIKHQARK